MPMVYVQEIYLLTSKRAREGQGSSEDRPENKSVADISLPLSQPRELGTCGNQH